MAEASDYEEGEVSDKEFVDTEAPTDTGKFKVGKDDSNVKEIAVSREEMVHSPDDQGTAVEFERCVPGDYYHRNRLPRMFRPRWHETNTWRGSAAGIWRPPRAYHPSSSPFMFPSPRYGPGPVRMIYQYPTYLPSPFMSRPDEYCMMMSGAATMSTPHAYTPHGPSHVYLPSNSAHRADNGFMWRKNRQQETEERCVQKNAATKSFDKLKDANNQMETRDKPTSNKISAKHRLGQRNMLSQERNSGITKRERISIPSVTSQESKMQIAEKEVGGETKPKFNRRFFGREGCRSSSAESIKSKGRNSSGSGSKSSSSSSSGSSSESSDSSSDDTSHCSCKDCSSNKSGDASKNGEMDVLVKKDANNANANSKTKEAPIKASDNKTGKAISRSKENDDRSKENDGRLWKAVSSSTVTKFNGKEKNHKLEHRGDEKKLKKHHKVSLARVGNAISPIRKRRPPSSPPARRIQLQNENINRKYSNKSRANMIRKELKTVQDQIDIRKKKIRTH